jgi:pyruvate kinase
MKELWFTLGPSSLDKINAMVLEGATGVRLTFSYGTVQLQDERAREIKRIAKKEEKRCYTIADLAGEKIRLGAFPENASVPVKSGTTIELVLDAQKAHPSNFIFPIPHTNFFSHIKKGNIVTVGDGAVVFEVTNVTPETVQAQIRKDGMINHCRGLTIQGDNFCPSSLTTKDRDDLKHILHSSVYDMVALSFVSSESDILKVKKIMNEEGTILPIIAKIETMAGVENIDSICRCADRVMAARGDLALAMAWEELPAAVSEISRAAYANSVPWILATQIAEGLERFAMPTRAEICDLAHWLKEGCEGVLLSYETVFGAQPIESVKCTRILIDRWGADRK